MKLGPDLRNIRI